VKKKSATNQKTEQPLEEGIAVKLIKQLDGYSIKEAKEALERAAILLSTTQIVSAKNRFLS
jgi:ribosomal protein L7/L12